MTHTRAEQIGDGRFRISGRAWAGEYDLALLPVKIAFYKRMAELPDTPRGVSRRKIYGPVYAALKVLQAEVNS